jgi:hypothetical protein
VDDAIAGRDVRLDDARAVDEHVAVADAHADALSVERLDGAALGNLGSGELAVGDVVEQDRAQLLLVARERVERRLRDLGEGLVGRGEDRERPSALQRLGEPGLLEE